VTMADDVVEELARVGGYDRIEPAPLSGALPPPLYDPVRSLRERLRDAVVAAGLQEIITYPLTTPDVLSIVDAPEELAQHPPLRLENPMSNEQAVMRTSLRASVLQAIGANLRRERGAFGVFECAHVFLTRPNDLPEERELIVGALGGVRQGRWGEPTDEALDFYDLKGVLEEAFERLGASVDFRPGEEFGLLRGRSAELVIGEGERIGVIGQVHPGVATRLDIDTPVFLFEIDVAKLLPAVQTEARHRRFSRFPAVTQDIAVLVDASVPAARVAELVGSHALVAEVRLFDVYEGSPLPAGKRSLAFEVHFQSVEKMLTEAEVADARRRIIRRLEHELGAELRGA